MATYPHSPANSTRFTNDIDCYHVACGAAVYTFPYDFRLSCRACRPFIFSQWYSLCMLLTGKKSSILIWCLLPLSITFLIHTTPELIHKPIVSTISQTLLEQATGDNAPSSINNHHQLKPKLNINPVHHLEMSHHPRPARPTSASNIILYVLAFFLPPLPVFIKTGCSGNFLLNLLLTLIAWFPGIIHAIWVVWRYEATYKLDPTNESRRGGDYFRYTGPDAGRERDGITGAYVERGTAGNEQWQGNMQGYYGPPPSAPPRPAPGMVSVPVTDGTTYNAKDQIHSQGQGQGQQEMKEEFNEKHEYRSI